MQLVEQGPQDQSTYITSKMYAVIDNGLVVGQCWENEKDWFINRYELINMTLENSPAYMPGIWDGKKFVNLQK